MRTSKRTARLLALLAVLTLLAAACSSGSDTKATPKRTTTTTAATRPEGPAADLSEEITGTTPPFMGEAAGAQLEGTGYVEHEYVAAGTATSYRPEGELTPDGRWTFAPDTNAPYRTRVLVRRPAKRADSSGTVVVEWLNVSGGVDADPDWTSLREEIVRNGDTWVGVSAQLLGVAGGPILVAVPGADVGAVAGKGLKSIDPERYGTLDHPGDGYSFDLFTQVARALRAGGAVTGGVTPQRIIAAGESQSAIALTTYIDGVQPLTHAFDGFFVHSRGSVTLPLVGPGKYADLAGGIGTTPTIFRTDTDVPILDLQSESDVTGILASAAVRQPDTDRVRLWEVAGTAHADAHLMGATADAVDCGAPVNDGPMHVVAKAAFAALETWILTGRPPARAPRLDLTAGATPAIRRDADGIALGGIRTPPVDVPVAVLSGVPGPDPAIICILLGSTKPLPTARIAELYSSRAEYQRKYDAAVRATIAAGYALRADRGALVAYADPARVSG